jgi:hypothetical protein
MEKTALRPCRFCEGTLPEGSTRARRFCTDRCRKAAWHQRQRGAVKVCTGCSRQKPARAFPKDGTKKDGRAPRCRVCKAAGEQRRYTPGGRPATMPSRQKYGPGDRFAELVIVERLGERNRSTWVRCGCDCGNVRDLKLSNLTSGVTTNCADRSKHPDPRSKGETVSYSGAHNRVKLQRGSASLHPCRFCGGQAEQWAYSHAGVSEQRDSHGKEKGKPYSPHVACYYPTCRGCHRRFDQARARLPEGTTSLAHHALWLATTAEEVTA